MLLHFILYLQSLPSEKLTICQLFLLSDNVNFFSFVCTRRNRVNLKQKFRNVYSSQPLPFYTRLWVPHLLLVVSLMWPRMQIPDLPLLRFYTYACFVPVWFLFDLPRPERPTSKRQPQSCFISLSAKQWKKGLFLPEQTTTELYFLWPCTGLAWSSNGKDTSEGRGGTNYACSLGGQRWKKSTFLFLGSIGSPTLMTVTEELSLRITVVLEWNSSLGQSFYRRECGDAWQGWWQEDCNSEEHWAVSKKDCKDLVDFFQ